MHIVNIFNQFSTWIVNTLTDTITLEHCSGKTMACIFHFVAQNEDSVIRQGKHKNKSLYAHPHATAWQAISVLLFKEMSFLRSE